jgi:cardiolipin synthase
MAIDRPKPVRKSGFSAPDHATTREFGFVSLPQFQLLAGSQAFWSRAAEDIGRARSRLLVQAMTFEGDEAGLAVATAIRASRARDRRILVDDFTRHVISDRFVLSPSYLLDRSFRAEIASTRAMFRAFVRDGIGVRTTNPIGFNPLRYGLRNHKKLIVADDVSYLGGINFSDHNFAWHDMMIRIEGAGPATFLAGDFQAAWDSRPAFAHADFGPLRLYALDGRTNRLGLRDLFGAIRGAERRIEIVTPYLSFPFDAALARAVERGVAVELITPLANNKPLVRDYALAAAARGGISVRLLPWMSHLKGMLIDERLLVAGSINFDFPSYHSMEEHVALIDDPALAADFRARVLAPLRAAGLPDSASFLPAWRALRSNLAMRLAGRLVAATAGMRRRAIGWRG